MAGTVIFMKKETQKQKEERIKSLKKYKKKRDWDEAEAINVSGMQSVRVK